MPVTIRKDLRSAFGPARDQQKRMTCMAFAASDAHAVAHNSSDPFSCEYAHFHAIRRKGAVDPNSGVSLAVMSETIEHDGQPLESDWAYLPVLPSDLSLWRPPPVLGAIFRRASVLHRPQVSDVVSMLDKDKPVIITMSITQSFLMPDGDFVINGNSAEPTLGTHALVAVGHGVRASVTMVLVRNSWGLGWGDKGHGWLPETYLSPRLIGIATMN